MTLWYRVAPLSPADADDRWWIVPARRQGAGRADNPRHYTAMRLHHPAVRLAADIMRRPVQSDLDPVSR